MKKNWLPLVLLGLVIGICLLPYKVTYYVGPGGVESIENRVNAAALHQGVEIERAVSENFFLVYTLNYKARSFLEHTVKSIMGYKSAGISNSDLNDEDQEQLSKKIIPFVKQDVVGSVISYLGLKIDQVAEHPVVIYIPEKYKAIEGLFMEGDQILTVNQMPIDMPSDLILDKELKEETVKVQILRNGIKKEVDAPVLQDVNNRPTLGLFVVSNFLFPGINVEDVIELNDIYGSSSGLMLALGLVQQLQPEMDLTHGLKIVGTGKIRRDGSIEGIDNLEMKIKTAAEWGADIFLYPSSMQEEAKATQKEHSIAMRLIPVETLADAIEKLKKEK